MYYTLLFIFGRKLLTIWTHLVTSISQKVHSEMIMRELKTNYGSLLKSLLKGKTIIYWNSKLTFVTPPSYMFYIFSSASKNNKNVFELFCHHWYDSKWNLYWQFHKSNLDHKWNMALFKRSANTMPAIIMHSSQSRWMQSGTFLAFCSFCTNYLDFCCMEIGQLQVFTHSFLWWN